MLADMVRTDSHQLRPAAGDSPEAEGIKVVARTHKTLIWDRTRAVQRLRHQLREYFPAALEAFEDLDAPDALELLGKAPDPARAARLTRAQVAAALKRARRRDIAGKTDAILAALRGEHLGQPAALTAAYAATARSLIAVITTLNEQVKILEEQVREHFGRHPDAEIYQSQPGLAAILGARVLGEFGDDPRRYADRKARKNYGGTSPITRASGKKKVVAARFIHNDRLIDALMSWAFSSLKASPGARAFYDEQRAKGLEHNDALRQAREPPRRHPARMPEDPHPLRRGHRLGPPGKPPSIFRCGLTSKLLGCLCRHTQAIRPAAIPATGMASPTKPSRSARFRDRHTAARPATVTTAITPAAANGQKRRVCPLMATV